MAYEIQVGTNVVVSLICGVVGFIGMQFVANIIRTWFERRGKTDDRLLNSEKDLNKVERKSIFQKINEMYDLVLGLSKDITAIDKAVAVNSTEIKGLRRDVTSLMKVTHLNGSNKLTKDG